MTVQGQSIVNVSMDLCIPVCSPGQLYIAHSHCTSATGIKVLFLEDSDTISIKNSLYKEILRGMLNH